MDIKKAPVLCGGTFFTLLLEAAKQGLNERKALGKNTDFTEHDVFEALIQVAVPTYDKPTDKDNFKSVVSAYKSCNTSKSGRLPIHEQANISSFGNRITNNYQAPLSAMSEFIKTYIDFEGKGDWLVRALLDLLCKDNEIGETELLFILQDGQPTSKSELQTLDDICLPALLLGVWHLVISKGTDNAVGKTTYDEWCKPGKSKNTREAFKSDIGSDITRPLNLSMLAGMEDDVLAEDMTPDDSGEPYTDETYSQDTGQPTALTINNNGFLLQQFGANNKQIIGNIETLVINNE